MSRRKAGSGGGGFSGRNLGVGVRTAKGRKISSTRWLQRQLNDPYVIEAQKRGYASRAAFKLIELDERFHFFKAGQKVVDLGAAPGGWTQVAAERIGAEYTDAQSALVIAFDINEMDSPPGALVLRGDFMDPDAPARIEKALGAPADVVLSDMAAPATGHSATDHLRIVALLEPALDFAAHILVPGGVFVAKVFQGGAEHKLLGEMKKLFKTVRHAKPPASRKESAETYVVAMGFRGRGI